jgi:hypothetical protein
MSIELTPIPDALDYAYYALHGGALSEDAFDAALPIATAAVDAAIWPNVVTDATTDAYRRAICAAIDADPDGMARAVASERVGGVSTTYVTAAGLSAHPVGRAISKHLTGTGLLYRGL